MDSKLDALLCPLDLNQKIKKPERSFLIQKYILNKEKIIFTQLILKV